MTVVFGPFPHGIFSHGWVGRHVAARAADRIYRSFRKSPVAGRFVDVAAKGFVMQDKRICERIEAPLEIVVTWSGAQQTKRAVTRDFSDSGAFVLVSFDSPPPVGAEILVQLNGLVLGKEPPTLKARVVRVTDEGVAFEFLGKDAE